MEFKKIPRELQVSIGDIVLSQDGTVGILYELTPKNESILYTVGFSNGTKQVFTRYRILKMRERFLNETRGWNSSI